LAQLQVASAVKEASSFEIGKALEGCYNEWQLVPVLSVFVPMAENNSCGRFEDGLA